MICIIPTDYFLIFFPTALKALPCHMTHGEAPALSMSHEGSQHRETAARCCLVMESKNSNGQCTPILCRLRHSASSSLCAWPSTQNRNTKHTHTCTCTQTQLLTEIPHISFLKGERRGAESEQCWDVCQCQSVLDKHQVYLYVL